LYYAKLFGLNILFTPIFSLLNSNVIFEKNNKAYGISNYTNLGFTILGYIIFLDKYGIPAIAITNVVVKMIQILVMIFFVIKDIKRVG
jgi:hypothetical protein